MSFEITTGIDIIEVERIKKVFENHKERFLKRVFTENEIKKFDILELAGKFACKEAVIKALGGRFGLKWTDIEILNNERGKPFVNTENQKLKKILKNRKIEVSISHIKELAVAICVIYESK